MTTMKSCTMNKLSLQLCQDLLRCSSKGNNWNVVSLVLPSIFKKYLDRYSFKMLRNGSSYTSVIHPFLEKVMDEISLQLWWEFVGKHECSSNQCSSITEKQSSIPSYSGHHVTIGIRNYKKITTIHSQMFVMELFKLHNSNNLCEHELHRSPVL